ncbi:MAG: glycosyltransferase family 4 protein [Erythrobacter sp.]
MRILMQVNVDREEAGGVQTLVRGVEQHYREAGHTVLSAWIVGSPVAAAAAGERIETFHIRPAHGPRGRRVHFPSLLRALRLLASFRPHVVNIHYASANAFYFLLLRRLFGYRILLSCHGSDVLKPLAHDAALMPRLLGGADTVTGVSPHLVEAIRVSGGDEARPVWLPNGVDTRFWHPGKAEGYSDSDSFELVTVGRLDPVKGFDVLIEAFAILRGRHPGARLTIVGEGEERAALARQAERLGVESCIEFAGRRSPEDLRTLLHRADLFVLPSRSEGMPLSLLEAMACALPCVATDVGGVGATCGEAGRIVAPEDPGALAEAMLAVARDPAARRALGEAARRRALEFSAAKTFARYEEIVRSLGSRP